MAVKHHVGGRDGSWRAPCGGWKSGQYFFGPPTQHYVASHAAVPVYTNTTLVPDFAGGADIPPYTRPDAVLGLEDCGGAGQKPCGPWPDPVPVNTYTGPTGTLNLASCSKVGFKTVFAQKCWQGRPPFGAECCVSATKPAVYSSPNGTRYRTISFSGTIKYGKSLTYSPADGGHTVIAAGDWITIYHSEGTQTIGQLNGKRSSSATNYGSGSINPNPISDGTFAGGNTEQDYYGNLQAIISAGVCTILDDGEVTDGETVEVWSPGSPTSTDYDYAHFGELVVQNLWPNNSGIPGGGTPYPPLQHKVVRTRSATVITFRVDPSTWSQGELDLMAGTQSLIDVDVTITLSNPYTSDDVNDDIQELLAQWPLDDDKLYPWRTDGKCTSGPMVLRFEQVLGSQYPQADPNAVDDSALPYDGSILGGPTAVLLNRVFSPRNMKWRNEGAPGFPDWKLTGYGAWSDDGDETPGTPYASYWVNQYEAECLLPGRTLTFNTLTVNPANPMSDALLAGNRLVGSKYAEVKIPWFSYNFGRPWGIKDLETRDQSTVNCTPSGGGFVNEHGNLRWTYPTVFPIDGRRQVSAATNASPIQITTVGSDGTPADHNLQTGGLVDIAGVLGNTAANGTSRTVTRVNATSFTIDGTTGNGAYTSGGYVSSTAAPDYWWNDNKPKGSYAVLSFNNNFRQDYSNALSGDYRPNTGGLYEIDVSTSCLEFRTCCPRVICLSNNGETFPNGTTYGSAVLDLDDCYGSAFYQEIAQWMADPLWQFPTFPCDLIGEGLSWNEDDGSGHTDTGSKAYFPQRPYVEFENTVPSGAPALPGSKSIAVLTVEQLNDSVTNGQTWNPPAQGGCYMPVWVWYLNLLSTIDENRRFSDTYADQMAAGSGDTELWPP